MQDESERRLFVQLPSHKPSHTVSADLALSMDVWSHAWLDSDRGQSLTVHQHVEMWPDVMLGKPVFRGTRVTVELLLRKLAEGITIEDLLDGYPTSTREDVHAAIQFAADTLAHEEVVFRLTGTER